MQGRRGGENPYNLPGSQAVTPMPDPHEQAFVAHWGEIAARDADTGKILHANHPLFTRKGNSAFSQRRWGAPFRSDPRSPIPFALSNTAGGLSWRRERCIGGKRGGSICLGIQIFLLKCETAIGFSSPRRMRRGNCSRRILKWEPASLQPPYGVMIRRARSWE